MSSDPSGKILSNQPSDPKRTEDKIIMLEEYQALRNEILKRIEFRYQLINIILVVSGTFLSVGVQPNVSVSVLLVYPILALFLTSGWVYNGIILKRIGTYIRENIETNIPELRWESYLKERTIRLNSSSPFSLLGTLSTSGLVLTTQVLAIVIALLKFKFIITDIVFLICSIVAIILTLIIILRANSTS
ncbi:hypothetical protein [Scytonema sp. PCC 10023]|uniref:hypothetical protein n=1 Tax=Scytonema sp. PCC 10023 TaxID=1680591 RepID=UPI0039C6BAC3